MVHIPTLMKEIQESPEIMRSQKLAPVKIDVCEVCVCVCTVNVKMSDKIQANSLV